MEEGRLEVEKDELDQQDLGIAKGRYKWVIENF